MLYYSGDCERVVEQMPIFIQGVDKKTTVEGFLSAAALCRPFPLNHVTIADG